MKQPAQSKRRQDKKKASTDGAELDQHIYVAIVRVCHSSDAYEVRFHFGANAEPGVRRKHV
jgi:hypothetical protein